MIWRWITLLLIGMIFALSYTAAHFGNIAAAIIGTLTGCAFLVNWWLEWT